MSVLLMKLKKDEARIGGAVTNKRALIESLRLVDLQWFAAEDEGRTEEPSETRIRRAREEGRVAKSQELTSAVVMLFALLTLFLLAQWILEQLTITIKFFFERCTEGNAISGTSAVVFFNCFLKIVLPIAVVATFSGIVMNLAQNKGWLFSTKPLQPKFSKIMPHFGEYLRRTVFSKQGAFNVFKSVFKVAVLVFIAYMIIKNEMTSLLVIMKGNGGIASAMGRIAWVAFKLIAFASVFFVAIAIPDYFVQKRVFLDSLKMSKKDVRDEYKEMEGDPEVKARIRQAQRQILQSNIPRAVAESDVVITNPTHFAVALKYDLNKADAPVVNAKGEDYWAERIKQFARENDVPIIENKPLARSIYASVEVGQMIPEEYFKAVSIIYTHLKKFGANKLEKASSL